MRIAIIVALVAVLGAAPLLGCAHDTRTVTTTETLECGEAESYEDELDDLDRECTQIRRETTVVTERGSDCHGAVSCSFSLVGQLVGLPFRILGEVLGTAF